MVFILKRDIAVGDAMNLFPISPCVKNLLKGLFIALFTLKIVQRLYSNSFIIAYDFSKGIFYFIMLRKGINPAWKFKVIPVVLVFPNLCVTMFAFIINQTGREILQTWERFQTKAKTLW